MPADDRTLTHYEEHAPEMAARFETAEMGRLHRLIRATLPQGARMLELGCGSGRDAALALEAGYDVTATDGSLAMLEEARRLHPRLEGRLRHLSFPSPFPFADGTFDAVLAVAALMHLPEPEIAAVVREVTRVLHSGGVLILSVPGRRADVGDDSRDSRGRLFTMATESRWVELCREAGLAVESRCASQDRLGRDHVEWWTFVARRAEEAS